MRRDETGTNARQERRGMLTMSQFSLARQIFLSVPLRRCSDVRPHRIRYAKRLHLCWPTSLHQCPLRCTSRSSHLLRHIIYSCKKRTIIQWLTCKTFQDMIERHATTTTIPRRSSHRERTAACKFFEFGLSTAHIPIHQALDLQA
jgi:hypothetical protein